jgi:hydrogenase nickel incorporation protein HypB
MSEENSRQIKVMANLLGANDLQAEVNRTHFQKNHCLAVNVIGSPGAGKTSLLERTLTHLGDAFSAAVIEGDIFTSRDADRIAALHIPVRQINTGGACHLDSQMVGDILPAFDWNRLDVVVIENVGNLVCPADFDLGEEFKVVVLSIAEGDDKPAKYPVIFRNAKAAVINKVDMKALCAVDIEKMKKEIMGIHPEIRVFEVSCRTGEGLQEWLDWLAQEIQSFKARRIPS